ncbi:MAG TPA: hypothetical protein VM864_15050 [Pyrinomonadaceae bacterium]|jgi:hypothetical protein|nr:hypothetical protein [Pyrinomonadaceae bacterium]
MKKPDLKFTKFTHVLLACALLAVVFRLPAVAQAQNEKPLESQELVRLVYQLPQHPERRSAVIEEIRRRGIGFELTSGMRSLVASKSGNDALLRRTLEEADRRRASPATTVRPNEAEARDVLERARQATRAAVGAMPDFVVKQLITRSFAFGTTKSWRRLDNMTVGVSYRESEGGERYKVLAVNGVPSIPTEARERGNYEQQSGASSTGEFVSMLKELFSDEAKAKFQAVDTDTIRERRAIIYEYEVKLENSQQTLLYRTKAAEPLVTRVGSRGRVWIDRESLRVLRLENIATDIPAGFPITAATNTVDYDWVTIAERKYLLPVSAAVEMTSVQEGQLYQTRNEIRFRNYQKFGAEVKIVEEGDFEEEPPKKKPE